MSAHDEAVEAACREHWGDEWDEIDEEMKAVARGIIVDDITAYLRHMRGAGVVMTQALKEKPPAGAANSEFWRGFYAGWNEYRSRALANAVDTGKA